MGVFAGMLVCGLIGMLIGKCMSRRLATSDNHSPRALAAVFAGVLSFLAGWLVWGVFIVVLWMFPHVDDGGGGWHSSMMLYGGTTSGLAGLLFGSRSV